jgi:hypothetical protein
MTSFAVKFPAGDLNLVAGEEGVGDLKEGDVAMWKFGSEAERNIFEEGECPPKLFLWRGGVRGREGEGVVRKDSLRS